MSVASGWHRRHFAAPESTGHLSVRAVVRLRWWALGVQAVAVGLVARVTPTHTAMAALVALVAVGVASNLAVLRLSRWPAVDVLGGLALLDVVLLTGLLGLTGGPANPFSVLYLTYVMLASIATNPAWTWSTVLLSSAGFGFLFFVSVPLPPELGGHTGHADGQPYGAHLQGMWFAHTVTAAVIARFVGRLSFALNRERETRAQTSRMLGLATLAAGAAHEIGNPLGTIRVAASELARDLKGVGASPDTVRDLDLIGEEVGRAHRVLEHMSIGAGELLGEGAVPTDLETWLRATVGALESNDRVVLLRVPAGHTVRWPLQATTQAVTQLVRNAIDASKPDGAVDLTADLVDGGVQIAVADEGKGMSAATLSRIGEPFFTTRPGEGQGLGVFIARSLVEHLGGHVQIDSAEQQGTVARVWLPHEVGP